MFWEAVAAAKEQTGLAACAATWAIDARPPVLSVDLYGNGCEPGWTRHAISLVRSLLLSSPPAPGLEWGAGSSTLWLLQGLVTRLYTVEHNPVVMARVNETLQVQMLVKHQVVCCVVVFGCVNSLHLVWSRLYYVPFS